MLDVWSWISDLPSSEQWCTATDDDNSAVLVFELASSPGDPTQSLLLQAERTSSNSDAFITLSVCLRGFQAATTPSTLWVSDTYPLINDTFLLPLLLQLLQEIVTRAPTAYNSTCPRSQFQKLRPEPVSWILDTHSPESFSSFFNLVFLTRLFWACACDAPCEVGSFYLHSLLCPNIESLLTPNHAPVLRKFLVAVGADAELCLMRTLGYMLAKWLISRDVAVSPGAGLRTLVPPLPPCQLGFSYATEAHGFWALKGYAPIPAMRLSSRTRKPPPPPHGHSPLSPFLEPSQTLLKYALAHQQLEAVIQFQYSVVSHDAYIQVSVRVDNLRFHVARLGFRNSGGDGVDLEYYTEERHFVSRARAWLGPEIGATYVASLSVGRSTHNGESETTELHVAKGSPESFAVARTATRMRVKDWRWDQDVEGNAVVFDAVLCDTATGREYYSDGDGVMRRSMASGGGPNRPFTKARGLIFGGDEYGDEVTWRLGKEMEGSVLKWRIGGEVWVSYFPNNNNNYQGMMTNASNYYCETRCVEWCDEVDLPLIPPAS